MQINPCQGSTDEIVKCLLGFFARYNRCSAREEVNVLVTSEKWLPLKSNRFTFRENAEIRKCISATNMTETVTG
jgi:hypothetical protein